MLPGSAVGKGDVFHALADPSRRQILTLLADTELPIVEIAGHFAIGRTAINKHLAVLSQAGLVHGRRVGRETRYRLDPAPLRQVEEWLRFFDGYWNDQLAALAQYVEAPREDTPDRVKD